MAWGKSPYDISAIQQLLTEAFTPEDLYRFCQNRPTFRPIIARFGPGMGLDDMVDQVMDYCRTQFLWDGLLAAVKEVNPNQYARFEPYLSARPPTSRFPPSVRKQGQTHTMSQQPLWVVGGLLAVLILTIGGVSWWLITRERPPSTPTAAATAETPPTTRAPADPVTWTPASSDTPTTTDTPKVTPTPTDTPKPVDTLTPKPTASPTPPCPIAVERGSELWVSFLDPSDEAILDDLLSRFKQRCPNVESYHTFLYGDEFTSGFDALRLLGAHRAGSVVCFLDRGEATTLWREGDWLESLDEYLAEASTSKENCFFADNKCMGLYLAWDADKIIVVTQKETRSGLRTAAAFAIFAATADR